MTFGEKIQALRKAKGLSQEELAALVSVSRQAVSKWELGEATPEIDKIVTLARVFGVTVDQLLSADELPGSGGPEPAQAQAAGTSRGPDHAGRIFAFIRRKGYLAGFFIAASGLPIVGIGALAHYGFKQMMEPALGFDGVFDQAMPAAMNFPLVFAGAIMAVGGVIVVSGLVLAFVLKRKAQ